MADPVEDARLAPHLLQIGRFLASGGIGITVNLSALALLVRVFSVPYLLASVLAVSCSTIIGFLLQKHWTFSGSSSGAARQFGLYACVAVANIGLNTGIVYVLSGLLGVHYLLAQFIGAAAIAISSFLIYRLVIFSPMTSNSAA